MGSDLDRLLRLADAAADRDLLGQIPSGDGAALTELVRRHGPLVMGACRRVLGHEQDAEDAFQAAFLVLAARAGSVRKDGSVGAWLYGTARHVSLRLRDKERRRRRHETAAHRPEAVWASPHDDEWRGVLDEELGHLPDLLRQPLVACYLAGRTQEDVARELGWSLSTLRRRLDRGRELLRARMVHRGVTLPAGAVLVGGVTVVPRALAEAVVQSVAKFMNGDRGSAPAVLAQGVLAMMARAKLLKAGVVALSLVGAVVVWQAGGAAQPAPTNPAGGQVSKAADPQTPPGAKAAAQPAKKADDRIKAGDRLFIQARNVFESDPIDGLYVVERAGTVVLGPTYGGRVKVESLTPEQAEVAVRQQVRLYAKAANITVTVCDPADSPSAQLEERVRRLEQEVLELRAAVRALKKGP